MNTEALYRLPAAAAILKVHPRTLKRWHADGKLRLVELPSGHFRVPVEEITRLLAQETEPQPEEAEAA